MSFLSLLLIYFIGGITFIPLLLLAIFCHAYLVLPQQHGPSEESKDADETNDKGQLIQDEKFKQGVHDADGASGYFAVCREYVPGGVNGKPPARTTPAGEAISAESPSVYQSMYRSIFERGKSQAPGIEAGTPTKKARNVFFVILRHGHLVLFDNSEQLDIRHVISLAHHEIDVYSGGDPIPEGELWIRRNCIRLRKRAADDASEQTTAPFYLFSDNCSEKEDFYHAMILHHQDNIGPAEQRETVSPLHFDTEDIFKLIRYLHISEENNQARWLNAVCGRLFLALYKTSDIEDFVRRKITTKMERVAKPAFITSLRLEQIELGNSAPLFVNPKLRDMTVDGALTVEADVRYTGNFKAVIAAVARIDLGSRFKPREVNMVLAGVLKKLEGHLLLRIKPPPSNRLWITFETMPKLDISLEPIVSSRQITYGVVLRAMVSRIREVFGETLVQPNWDDIPFVDTATQAIRGGIWKENNKVAATIDNTVHGDILPDVASQPIESTNDERGRSHSVGIVSMPVRADTAPLPPTSSPPDTPNKTRSIYDDDADSKSPFISTEKPKAMRSNSFAAAASPIVSKSPATTETLRRQAKKGQRDATAAMKTLSSRSPEKRPDSLTSEDTLDTELDTSGDRNLSISDEAAPSEASIRKKSQALGSDGLSTSRDARRSKARLRTASASEQSASPSGKSTNAERAKAINQSIATATVAAKNWSWNMLNRQSEDAKNGPTEKSEPMGRGQPLPPFGTPLPKPEKPAWSAAALTSLRRKPVASNVASASQPVLSKPDTNASEASEANTARQNHTPPEDDILTVSVPSDSAATTPERRSFQISNASDPESLPSLESNGFHDERAASSISLAEEHYAGQVSEVVGT